MDRKIKAILISCLMSFPILTGCGTGEVQAETMEEHQAIPIHKEMEVVDGGIRVNKDIKDSSGNAPKEDANYQSADRHNNFEMIMYEIGQEITEDDPSVKK